MHNRQTKTNSYTAIRLHTHDITEITKSGESNQPYHLFKLTTTEFDTLITEIHIQPSVQVHQPQQQNLSYTIHSAISSSSSTTTTDFI